ncbi:MAG: TonB family protein [Bacteroidota bacterium]|nr:TonB family protein [Bacteroidota bacterium]
MNSNSKIDSLFTASGCLNNRTIQRYLSGELSDIEKSRVAEHISECAFCSDAIEGAQLIESEKFSGDIVDINNKISQKLNNKKSLTLKKRKKILHLSYISAAASIIIILSVFFYVDSLPSKKQLAIADKKELNDTVLNKAETISLAKIEKEPPITKQIKEAPKSAATKMANENKDINPLQKANKVVEKLNIVENDIEIEDDNIYDDIEKEEEQEVVADIHKETKDEKGQDKIITQTYAVTSSEIAAGVPKTSQRSKTRFADVEKKSNQKSEDISLESFELEEESAEQEVFFVVEEMPKFKGKGLDEFKKYIQKNLRYPVSASENGISGKVYVSFVINEKGKVKDVKIVRSVCASLDKEAMRVVKESPKWTPGKQQGKAIKVGFTIPIDFNPN